MSGRTTATKATAKLTTPATIETSRNASTSSTAVRHQRPRTSRNDRPSAFRPRSPSVISTGSATAKATQSQIPGARQKTSMIRMAIPPRITIQRIEWNRRSAKPSESRQSGFSPR